MLARLALEALLEHVRRAEFTLQQGVRDCLKAGIDRELVTVHIHLGEPAQAEVVRQKIPLALPHLSGVGAICHRLTLLELEAEALEDMEKKRQVAEQMQKELTATHPYTIRAWSKAALLCIVSYPQQALSQSEAVFTIASRTFKIFDAGTIHAALAHVRCLLCRHGPGDSEAANKIILE